VLAHVIHRIRHRWPHVNILVRGDGHYRAPEVLDLLRKLRCNYIVGLSRSKMLDGLAGPCREECQRRWQPSLGPVRRFHQFKCAAGSWGCEEQVIARIEVTAMWTDYCARERMENLIKDMKHYTRF
jgi:Transposase DDE domain group 1